MTTKPFPVIDPVATGENILRLRKQRGLTVRDLQNWFGFEEPQAIYKWQKGKSLPTVDNLYALGALLEVSMEDILVSSAPNMNTAITGQQAKACCPELFSVFFCRYPISEPRKASKIAAKLSFTSKGFSYSALGFTIRRSGSAETASAFCCQS